MSPPSPAVRIPEQPVVADFWYRKHMGWQTVRRTDEVRLRLGENVVGFQVPTQLGRRILGRFDRVGVVVPAVEHKPSGTVVVLADANGGWWSQADLPVGVQFLCSPVEVPLPPSKVAGVEVSWLRPVDPRRPWLPLAESVLGQIHAIMGLDSRPDVRQGRLTSPWTSGRPRR
ncbi:hypothetical protein [Kibdelosporangium aridum]|uniref:hypothetical protein n=1 Tax=Kibdelosporangium aridum TaxID=2030 RepID=UPI0035EF5881